MTCVVAVVDRGIVHMAADSGAAAWSGYDYQVRRDAKVFRLGEAVVGFTSSFRMGQILKYELKLPEIPQGCDLHEYMVRVFVPRLREAAKAAGVMSLKDGVEQLGVFLVGLRGRLFFVDNDMQVGEMVDSYFAVGSGAVCARGALYALQKLSKPPAAKRRLLLALEAASATMQAIVPPYQFVSTEKLR